MLDSKSLQALKSRLKGTLHLDALHKALYATDASVYRKTPLAVAVPKDLSDLQTLAAFAQEQRLTLIPRAAGTSLAGQCVGNGIVVDTSKHFTEILTLDPTAKTVTLEPGVIRDDLNRQLQPQGLFFGPNTSTSNRCMLGGMVGNNSSGSTSIKYGVTRDKVLALETVLSDGSVVTFSEITSDAFIQKTSLETLEGRIYKQLYEALSQEMVQQEIKKQFPKPDIHRRNTGYAIDALLDSDLFGGNNPKINVAKLVCGSEGTLAFTTKITLQLEELPPQESVMVTSHFTSIQESMEAVVVAMKHDLYTCELMDKVILDCTKNNREQSPNRFFLKGDPQAILMLEVKADTKDHAAQKASVLIADLESHGFGYCHPKIFGADIDKVMDLRKAGLGLLGNIIGDKKAVACIEDTAVSLEDLPNYIKEFTQLMERYQQDAVYYAHAGAGELHLRPILNLKKKADVKLFREITTETAKLVKKYKGSFSGEHGDGIVRAEFIPLMIGEQNYKLLRQIKYTFDPDSVFNKGKIVDAFRMDDNLRYQIEREEPKVDTLFNFKDNEGILRFAEKCNGSGDCRKPSEAGGTMCPSYRATKNEKDTTRARANALREFLTNSDKVNKFDHQELKEVFDLCLSCKACATECPSNVDVATLKAEFQYQYQEANGYSFRNKLFAKNADYAKLGSRFSGLTNWVLNTKLSKTVMGIAQERSIPKIAAETLRYWFAKQNFKKQEKSVQLFCDEFTNYYDVTVGKDAIILLETLGYSVSLVKHAESGRSLISKGFLKEAKQVANTNITIFKNLISKDLPLIGIEPSAILTFKDEYLRLADDEIAAKEIASHTFTIETFLQQEFKNGNINETQFSSEEKTLKIHGHCHQKALTNASATFEVLTIPENYTATIYSSGCCGMAGSFGYEKEHYDISMQIGEESIFNKVRNTNLETEIAASGTSCRHQIFDGTQRIAKHPVTILREALINDHIT
jgi:FAD/FMN-containing dehydrogenase/Fe-S oxidoreductase